MVDHPHITPMTISAPATQSIGAALFMLSPNFYSTTDGSFIKTLIAPVFKCCKYFIFNKTLQNSTTIRSFIKISRPTIAKLRNSLVIIKTLFNQRLPVRLSKADRITGKSRLMA